LKADTIYHNGIVLTMVAANSAQALAIKGDKIIAVGSIRCAQDQLPRKSWILRAVLCPASMTIAIVLATALP
jgi:predicted amidohydrolase YtcJ